MLCIGRIPSDTFLSFFSLWMMLDMFSLPLPDTASEEIERLKAVRLRPGSDVLLARSSGVFSAIQAVLVNTLEEGEFHPARAPLAQ